MDLLCPISISASKISFSAEEKELLVALLRKEKIIEDKRTNKSTNKLKAEAWDRITKRYNSHAFVNKREAIQLRRCWEKIKRLTKDARSKEIKTRMATGGGSPSLPNVDYVPGVEEVVPHLMYEIPSTVDSDTLFKINRQAEIYKTELSPQLQKDYYMAASDMTADVSSQATPVVISDLIMKETGIERETQIHKENQPPITSNISLLDSTETTPVRPSTRSGLQNCNPSVRKRKAQTMMASDVISTRQVNILKEREQQQELYLLRRSILNIEKEKATEELHHSQKINRIKEILEEEKLQHQRTLWRIELEHLHLAQKNE